MRDDLIDPPEYRCGSCGDGTSRAGLCDRCWVAQAEARWEEWKATHREKEAP